MTAAGTAAATGETAEVVRDRRLSVLVLIALVALVAVVPAMPAFWRGGTNLSEFGNARGGRSGVVTVERCSRSALAVTWLCEGRYTVNDPMAQPYPPVDAVVVVNDTRWHAVGTQVGVILPADNHRAYRWGDGQQVRTVVFWLGVLLCGTAALLGLRRKTGLAVVGIPLGIGVVALLAAHPYL